MPSEKAKSTHSSLFISRISDKPRDPERARQERQGNPELLNQRRQVESHYEHQIAKDDLLSGLGWD